MIEVLSGGRAAALGCVLATGMVITAPPALAMTSLSASIALVGRASLGTDRLASYSVTVRPAGGIARSVALTLITQEPLRWAGYPAQCRPAGRVPQVRCVLGDLDRPGSVQVTVRVPGALRVAGGVRILAVAAARNVARQSVTEMPLNTPPGSPAPSRTVRPPAGGGAAVTPSHGGVRPRAVKPRKRPPRRPRAQAAPPMAPQLPPSMPMPPAPAPMPAPMPAPAPPPLMAPMPPMPPMAPMPPMPPPMPMAPPPLPGQPGGGQPSLPPLTPGAPTPSVAPPGVTSPPPGVTPPGVTPPLADGGQMTMISPARGDEDGGTSWAVVLAIAVVAEVALLWIAACLGLWRRRLIAAQAARAATRADRTAAPGALARLAGSVRRRLRRR